MNPCSGSFALGLGFIRPQGLQACSQGNKITMLQVFVLKIPNSLRLNVRKMWKWLLTHSSVTPK